MPATPHDRGRMAPTGPELAIQTAAKTRHPFHALRRLASRGLRRLPSRPVRRAWTRYRIRRAHPLRVVLGASGIAPRGWIATEQDTLDLLRPEDWRIFKDYPADAFLAEHVWEHLTLEQGRIAARHCHEALRNGGYVRVAVPDGGMPDPERRAAVAPGGSGAGAHNHRVLYTLESLAEVFAQAGFAIEPLEHYDRSGRFHAREWDPEDGLIHRSLRFDPRNRPGALGAPSVILDARKRGRP